MARIMVVDDNRELADNLVEILSAEGHDAVAAYDGRQALRCSKHFNFDTALVDMRMPRMSGMTLVGRLMENKPRSRYLFMTAYRAAETASEAVAIQQRAVLDKPLDVPRLLRLVA